MNDKTETLIKAMLILVDDIQSDDGVVNQVIRSAAYRLEEQDKEIERLRDKLELLYVQASYAIGDLAHAMRTTLIEHKLTFSQVLEEKHNSIIKKTTKGEF